MTAELPFNPMEHEDRPSVSRVSYGLAAFIFLAGMFNLFVVRNFIVALLFVVLAVQIVINEKHVVTSWDSGYLTAMVEMAESDSNEVIIYDGGEEL